MKQELVTKLSTISSDILNLSKYLYQNPELSYKEYKACTYITNLLKAHNFTVTDNFLDIPTAFYAQYGSGHPKVCYFCEYDAFRDLGHITGHNLVASISAAAAISLTSILKDIKGTIIVIGCPGEYLGGAKVTMARQGVFEDIDVGLMAHPDLITAENGTSNAIIPLEVRFRKNSDSKNTIGSSYSPMDACILTFNMISFLSKGFCDGCSIDGILGSGQVSPSIISSESDARFYIRAPKTLLAEDMEKKLRTFIETTKNIMDMKSEVSIYELPYEELIPNHSLSRIFFHNLKESGIIDISDIKNTESGLSLGNVSHRIPCIQPYISIIENKSNIKYASPEFAAATISEYAHSNVMKAAQALAFTGFDIITNSTLLHEVKAENFSHLNRIINYSRFSY